MPRNTEVTRQWRLLRALDANRHGLTVDQLREEAAGDGHLFTKRTIYRDLSALQEAGFGVYTDTVDGRTRYKLNTSPFARLTDTGFSFSEVCALYLSRRVVEMLTGVPFQAALDGAFGKFEQIVPASIRTWLEQIPGIVAATPSGGKINPARDNQELLSRLFEATLRHHAVRMLYFSLAHRRKKQYLVHPYRIVYAGGGLYLFAFVPEYDQIRTFATQRIRQLTVLEDTFAPPPLRTDDPFSASIGPGSGLACHVVVRFDPDIAPIIRERIYHHSQRAEERHDGSLDLHLDVCDDAWLRSWILGFGHLVTVLEPASLAAGVAEELDRARSRYTGASDRDEAPVTAAFLEFSWQGRLPFGE